MNFSKNILLKIVIFFIFFLSYGVETYANNFLNHFCIENVQSTNGLENSFCSDNDFTCEDEIINSNELIINHINKISNSLFKNYTYLSQFCLFIWQPPQN